MLQHRDRGVIMDIGLMLTEVCLGAMIIGYGVIYEDGCMAAIGGILVCDAGHKAWKIINGGENDE